MDVCPPSDTLLSSHSVSESDNKFSGMVSNSWIKAFFAFDLVMRLVYLPLLLVVGTEALVLVLLVVVVLLPLPFQFWSLFWFWDILVPTGFITDV